MPGITVMILLLLLLSFDHLQKNICRCRMYAYTGCGDSCIYSYGVQRKQNNYYCSTAPIRLRSGEEARPEERQMLRGGGGQVRFAGNGQLKMA